MSELIGISAEHRAVRRILLTTVSTFSLVACASMATPANAEDADRPTVWIELGGQLDLLQGTSSPFTAPFMALTPVPKPYAEDSLIDTQRPPRHAFGLEGRITVQPQDSDWILSVAIRYGRSSTNRHVHHQSAGEQVQFTLLGQDQTKYFPSAPFADTKLRSDESHALLDFQVGHDIGVGMFGPGGASVISGGIRFAQFGSTSSVDIHARPVLNTVGIPLRRTLPIPVPEATFYAYTLAADASRSFRGIGPSLSWNASAVLVGSEGHGKLLVDWGLNGSLLFGRQKAATDHETQAYHRYYRPGAFAGGGVYVAPYAPRIGHSDRSRSVIVPNLGGFAGISVEKATAKLSLGYRADFFFGAADTGIDARQTKDLGFHGPFATISIGLGG